MGETEEWGGQRRKTLLSPWEGYVRALRAPVRSFSVKLGGEKVGESGSGVSVPDRGETTGLGNPLGRSIWKHERC